MLPPALSLSSQITAKSESPPILATSDPPSSESPPPIWSKWSPMQQHRSIDRSSPGLGMPPPLSPWIGQTAQWSPMRRSIDCSSPVFGLPDQQDNSVAQLHDLMAQMTMSPQSARFPSAAFSTPTFEQQQAALVMHLMASGYAYQYAQMAATAALNCQMSPDPSRFPRFGIGSPSLRRQPQGAPYVWTGEVPPRTFTEPTFSSKIFVGGCPWDITEQALLNAFKPYGPCRVEWPGKEARYARSVVRVMPRGKVTGYVYIIFDQERSVRSLLADCSKDFGSGNEWYFKLTAKRMRTKEIRQVQIIPWVVSDATYLKQPAEHCDPKKTVFVGALHGMITAQVLFKIMDDVFGNVVFAAIDTDKYKYPIGSGRVTFGNQRSYFKSVESAFVEIKTSKFTKCVQIDPFLEEAECSVCDNNSGPYFCRDMACFRYFCRPCWQTHHQVSDRMRQHKPLMRNIRRPTLESEDVACGSSSSSGGIQNKFSLSD